MQLYRWSVKIFVRENLCGINLFCTCFGFIDQNCVSLSHAAGQFNSDFLCMNICMFHLHSCMHFCKLSDVSNYWHGRCPCLLVFIIMLVIDDYALVIIEWLPTLNLTTLNLVIDPQFIVREIEHDLVRRFLICYSCIGVSMFHCTTVCVSVDYFVFNFQEKAFTCSFMRL